MRALMVFVAAAAGSVAASAFAQDGMELQRCIWQCLANSSGNDDPAYHECVERMCVAGEDAAAAPPPMDDQQPDQPDRSTIIFVQQRLAALGYDPGPADGVYGPRTAAAIQAFLADRGLPPEAGITDTLIAALQ